MKSLMPVFIMILISLTLVSCGGSKKTNSDSQSSLLKTFFVHGDPRELINGSILNQKSFITTTNIDQFNNFNLASVYQFTEKEEIISTTDDIEEGNEPTEENLRKKSQMNYNFKSTNGHFIYRSDKLDISLHFILENGYLNVKQIESDNEFFDVSVLHYSLYESGNAFSILLETSDSESGKVLISLSFIKNSPMLDLEELPKRYHYSYGPGVPVKWDQKKPLTVKICGRNSNEVNQIYSSAVTKGWGPRLNGELENVPRLVMNVEVVEKYPPFSDLNSHCIYTVKNYLTEPDPRFVNSASTIKISDMNKGEIIDSDIFIWGKEMEKYEVPFGEAKTFSRTILHEIGHLLGLDHQFDGTASIMSYNNKHNYLTSYDLEAIYALYPRFRN